MIPSQKLGVEIPKRVIILAIWSKAEFLFTALTIPRAMEMGMADGSHQGEFYRGRQSFDDHPEGRVPVGERNPHVSGHGSPEEVPVLLPERLVQAELGPDLGDRLGIRQVSGDDLRRVSRHGMNQDEHQGENQPENHNPAQETSD
jgi:hypothetical protein